MMPKDSTFVAMGMAALVPGMQHMIELMQAELDRMRAMLQAAQNGDMPVKRGPGRPRKNPGQGPSRLSGWDRFPTPEARSREILRRRAVSEAKAKGSNARRDAAARKGIKGYWAKMTPEQRSAEVKRRRAVQKANRAA